MQDDKLNKQITLQNNNIQIITLINIMSSEPKHSQPTEITSIDKASKKIKPKLSKAQFKRYTHAFLYQSRQNIPFTITATDLEKRNKLRMQKIFYTVGSLLGVNAFGYMMSKKIPKYKTPVIILTGISSLGAFFLGGMIVELDARKYLKRKFMIGQGKNDNQAHSNYQRSEKQERKHKD